MSIIIAQKPLICAEPCRVCFDKDFISGVDLSEDQTMLKLFEFCVGISINIKLLPKRLCFKCAENIKNYVKFKQKCLESEEHWKLFCEDIYKCDITKCKEELITKVKEEVKSETQENIFYNEQKYFDGHLYGKNSSNQDTTLSSDSDNIVLEHYKNSDNFSFKLGEYHYESNDMDKKAPKKYHCKKCNKEYRKHKWLMAHKKNVCNKDNHKEMNISKRGNINKNINLDKSNIENIPASSCGLCNIPYNCDIAKHMNEHWSNNDLKCQLCNYSGRDFADMITHSFHHCPKMKLICPVCKKKKASISSLQFHFRSTHLEKPGGFCSVCSKTFKNFKTWKRHERFHNENSLFICDHCGRKFLYKHEIKSHLFYHTDIRLFVCETCGKGFRRMSGLKDHIENMHSLKHPVKCDHCSKTYKNERKLEIHLRNIAKDKPFICEVCSKRFITEKVLQKHMFWHTGERPYRCEVCGSRYKAKGQLNLHMRNHTGFMPHKCLHCGKSFPAAKQLKRHQSVHTGIRAHKCIHCERSFHEKKAMLEHATLHKCSENVKSET